MDTLPCASFSRCLRESIVTATTIWVERLIQHEGKWVWKPQAEHFDTEADFSIDDGNLNPEICRMGQLLVRYGDLAAQMQANLKRKEENVKYIRDRVSGYMRSSAEAAGDKMTEGKLSEKVTVDASYQKALGELHIMRADALKAEHWWRSIIKKAELLNALAYRQGQEMKRI
jgi:hypothetical protein